MAKKKQEKSYSEYIDIKKVPILPLDNRWHQLFPDNDKPANIRKLEKEVMAIVKREGGINRELKKLSVTKKNLMNQIVANMNEASDEDEKMRQKKMATSQKLIMDIKKKTVDLEDEKYELPYRLLELNEQLLVASIEICYNKININQQKIAYLNEWIENTRNELKKNVIIRQEMQENNNNIYSYMHDILGPRFMEVFDEDNNYKMQGNNEGN